MTNTTKSLHDEKVKSLADKYVSEGFQVLIEPQPEQLPFDLDNYRPDIVAIKDNAGFVIEIKTRTSQISVERLKELAEEVSKHPGWRFLLATLEDTEAESLPGTSEQFPSWQELTDRYFQAHRLIENNEIEPAFLFLWIIFEVALRKRAVEVSIPVERFPIIGLIKQMYSFGELSISQFDLVQTCFEMRNRLAHGYMTGVNLQIVHDFDNLVCELLAEWVTEIESNQKLQKLAATISEMVTFETQIVPQILASGVASIDEETRNKILLVLKQYSEEKGLENHYNEFKRLVNESFDTSIESDTQQLNKNKVVLQNKVNIGLDSLELKERENILSVIKRLEEFPNSCPIQAHKLKSIPNYFIVPAGIYRVIFDFKPGQVTIVDIVHHDRLEMLDQSLKQAKA